MKGKKHLQIEKLHLLENEIKQLQAHFRTILLCQIYSDYIDL
jgi:hypothetical protein